MTFPNRSSARPRRLAFAFVAFVASFVSGSCNSSGSGLPVGRIKHVFVIVLENESYDTSFGASSPAPYLSQTLPAQGQLLTRYFATAHLSLPSYIAMISGQAPSPKTQGDCHDYLDF